MTSLWKQLVIVFLLILAAPDLLLADQATSDEKTTVDTEKVQREKLMQAKNLIASRNSTEAISLIDQTLEYYRTIYPDGKTRWYVARTPEETFYYMTSSAILPDSTSDKKDAATLYVAWAEAYFLKGYAYVELGQINEAKAALEQALYLTPQNANYMIELAEVSKLERDWGEAYRLYTQAEEATRFSPLDEKASDLSHAKRGQAFVFIEQGKLNEAEKILKQCL
ncbi:MAG: tetratricopeptide repeat protein, partial [Arenimonas sp.]